jgi:hypothetical protein
MLLPPSIYVVAGDAVKGGMTTNEKNGVVRGVVSAENAAGTNQS